MKEAQQQRLTDKYADGLRQEQLVDFFAMWMCEWYVCLCHCQWCCAGIVLMCWFILVQGAGIQCGAGGPYKAAVEAASCDDGTDRSANGWYI